MNKYFLMLIVFFMFTNYYCQNTPCSSNKGIKSTTHFWKVKSRKGRYTKKALYDTSGKILSVKSSLNDSEKTYYYEGDTLIAIVDKRTVFSRNTNDYVIKIDTIKILKWDSLGLPQIIKYYDNLTAHISYIYCEKQIDTLLYTDGTINQINTMIFKDDYLVKTIFKPNNKNQKIEVSKYFDYKLNRKGDWVRRKYQIENQPIIKERRKLKYY